MGSANKDEVKVGFNWIIRIPLYFLVYLSVKHAIHFTGIGDWGGLLIEDTKAICIAIFTLLLASVSMKCTSIGCHIGLRFFFFSFYFKRCNRWEEFPDLKINNYGLFCDISFTNGRNYNDGWYIFHLHRHMESNFDEMAELISRNALIKRKIRQGFIDYVNARKQQSTISKMLPTIITIAIIAIALFLFYKVFLNV